MRQYYEELWERLPDALDPPDYEARRKLLTAELRQGDRVLDLGCGAGTFSRVIADAGAGPVGVDVAQAAIDRARRQYPDLEFRLAPIDGPLPLPDGAFDLVWASEVIEHVADTQRWLEEIRRVLKPPGRLLITTPNHTRIKLLLHGIERYSEPFGDHLHLYSRRSLNDALAETGFTDIRISARNTLIALAVKR